MAKTAKKIPSPIRVSSDLMWGGWATYALAAAAELDVFSAIEAGNVTAAEIARAVAANEGMTRRLLDTLVALKYLTRKGEKYALTPESSTYLARGSDLYIPHASRLALGQMMGWAQLANVVRSGAPMPPPGGREAMGEFFAMLVKTIFPPNYVAARQVAASLPRNVRARIENVLDVAAGAAAWSIPFAKLNRKTRVTVVDTSQVTPVTREYAAKFGVAEQFEYLEGDLHEVDFGKGRYDLIILGHIIHGEGRENGQRLIGRSAEALRDKGMLLIAELIPNDDRSGPALPMLFGLNMMLFTPGGDVFTMKDYRGWLKDASFRTIKTLKSPSAPSPLILATK